MSVNRHQIIKAAVVRAGPAGFHMLRPRPAVAFGARPVPARGDGAGAAFEEEQPCSD